MPFHEQYPYFKLNTHFSLTSGICHARKSLRADDVGRRHCVISDERRERTKQNKL